MSANIDTMMYVGETPWHKRGTRLNNPATAEEALKTAKLDWEVKKEPLFRVMSEKVEAYATVRKDTNCVLGIVGERYTILQNKEAFSFFDAVVGEKAAIYHTAGSLGQGEKIWILAKLPESVSILKGDQVDNYILLAHSHDGSLRINFMLTPIRVVCQNTLNATLASSNETRISLKHTQNVGLKVTNIREALGLISENFNVMTQAFQSLTKKQISDDQFKKLVSKVGLISADIDDKLPTRTANMLEEISKLFEAGQGTSIPGVKGTAWGAFNAITEFLDYKIGKKAAESTLFGKGAKIKTKAFNELLAL